MRLVLLQAFCNTFFYIYDLIEVEFSNGLYEEDSLLKNKLDYRKEAAQDLEKILCW
jgi:hypothetical protein